MEKSKRQEKLLTEFPIPSYDQWLKLVGKQLNGVPFEKKLVSKSAEDVAIKPIYLKPDVNGSAETKSLPGFYPYTRGTLPAGYVKEGWKISQRYTYPDVSRLNEAIQHDLKRGLTSIMLILDQAGKKGLDPDTADPEEVGLCGASLCNQQDFEAIFKGVDLSETDVLLDAGIASFSMVGLWIGYLKSSNFELKNLKGAAIFDPLAFGCVHGELARSTSQLFDEMAGLVGWVSQHTPNFKPIGIDARPYADAGGSAVQELASALATAVEYIRELLKRGVTIDQAAGSMCLFLGIGADFFTEIAKLRAIRTLWAKIISAFGGSEDAQKLIIHSHSIFWNKTVHDPHVNILRTTTEAYSSVLGGCDSLCLASFDEIIGLPEESSRRISRNIQVILKEECHGHKVIDPAGGSWYVEELTRAISEKAWVLFQNIEKEGGFKAALEKGTLQDEINQTAKMRKELIAKRKQVIVGTNMYPNLAEKSLETKKVDQTAFSKTRIEQARVLKSARSQESGWTSLKDMSFQSPEFFNQIIETVAKGLTLGEINRILAKDYQSLRLSSPLKAGRLSDDYENLRKNADKFKMETGQYPKVFFANMGPLRQHKARADFSAGFLEPGGFEIITNKGFNAIEDAVDAAIASKAEIVVICSTDNTYPEWVPPLTKLIKKQQPATCILVAGYPQENINDFCDAGVDDFIHLKANNLLLLQKLQLKAGVSQ